MKQIADLEFVSNVGVAELLQQIADLQFVVNLGDFSSASGLKPRVSEILSGIADLQIPTNLGDESLVRPCYANAEIANLHFRR